MPTLDECDYKPDFEILDRYLNFSSELSRISLLAIGGFGAILLIKIKNENPALRGNLHFLFASICVFALCSGFSLIHRFFASDSMSWYISQLRAKASDSPEQANYERKGMHKMLRRSSFFLILTEVAFGIAVCLFSIGIYQIL
jgi:hypothetical protein